MGDLFNKLHSFFFLGFLLGKFVSDRQYKIKQLTQPEYETVIKQIQTLRRTIEITSKNVSDSTSFQSHPKYNRLFWDEAAACSDKTVDQNFDLSFEEFVKKLADNELDIVLECFIKLKNVITTIGID